MPHNTEAKNCQNDPGGQLRLFFDYPFPILPDIQLIHKNLPRGMRDTGDPWTGYGVRSTAMHTFGFPNQIITPCHTAY
jgi:hypothetical protein